LSTTMTRRTTLAPSVVWHDKAKQSDARQTPLWTLSSS